MEFLTSKLVVLYVFAACTLYVHFRGTVRYGFWRQLTNYSTFLAGVLYWALGDHVLD